MAKENSITNNSLYDQSPEESGWTIYFEDFLTNNNNTTHEPPSCFSYSSDLDTYSVADAASSVANGDERAVAAIAAAASWLNCKDIKKRKIKELMVHDDSLEDTASSPVNSPKVSDSTYFSRKQKQKENLQIPQVDKSREMGLVEMSSDYTELKKRGLCLVPLSMVVNYLAD